MKLAIFDLDNTLLNGDSDHAWGEFIIEKKIVDGPSHQLKNDQFYQDYLNGCLDIFAYQEFAMQILTQLPNAELTALRKEFMVEKIQPMILPSATALVEHHRNQQHELLIITATNRFITEPIAEIFNIPHLIATEPEIKDGQYTGKVEGIPSYSDGKIKRLEAWLKQSSHHYDYQYFYSDSHNDLPLLKIVDEAIAVNADDTLKQYASEQHWQILDLTHQN
ncbi:MAG: HAD-IB family hydrolase [Gammaproteobacteria bacterium]|nr:MAG: HAD-IB family hydrolase [Gammaproteobacteria bacterium]